MGTKSERGWAIAALAGVALLLQVVSAGAAWADAPAPATRQQIEAFEQSLQPIIQEARAIHDELGDLQQTLRDTKPTREHRDQPEQVLQDLETFRAANQRLARLERLTVSTEQLQPAPGLAVPFVDFLLAVQHTVAMVRNVQLWKLTGQKLYVQAATNHRTQFLAARARYAARMKELKREAAR